MNKSSLYTNSILTVIAGLLAVIALRPAAPSAAKSTDLPRIPIEVKLVASSFDLPVLVKNQVEKAAEVKGPIDINIVSVGGDSLSRVGSRIVLPVGVQNTVDVDVKGLNGITMQSGILSSGRGAAGFPVVILNQ
jgi:hypothetical protein